MIFTPQEVQALLWLGGGAAGHAVPIPQRLVLRGYVDFDHAFRPKPFLTRRGATSVRSLRAKGMPSPEGG